MKAFLGIEKKKTVDTENQTCGSVSAVSPC
jgi:hypothetical protein